jgi:hypothetical protein
MLLACNDNLKLVEYFGPSALDNATMLGESLIPALLESNCCLQTDHYRHRNTLQWIRNKEKKQHCGEEVQSWLPDRQVTERAQLAIGALESYA